MASFTELKVKLLFDLQGDKLIGGMHREQYLSLWSCTFIHWVVKDQENQQDCPPTPRQIGQGNFWDVIFHAGEFKEGLLG